MFKMALGAVAASLLVATPVMADKAADQFIACYTVEDFVRSTQHLDDETELSIYWAAKILEGKCVIIEKGEEYDVKGNLDPIPMKIIQRKGEDKSLYTSKGAGE